VDIAGGRRHRLVEAKGHAPVWSPDGTMIAFESGEERWAASADGSGGLRRLAPVGADPSWAPDSRRIVFGVRHHRGRYLKKSESLSIVDTASGSIRELTFG
jgi:Tol biopolymer transport system component